MAVNPVAVERTRQAIAAVEAGELSDARALLAEALSLDPTYELAWLWFAAVTEDPGEERFCLEHARDLDPNHRISPALARLRGTEPQCPPELAVITDPPPPDFINDYARQARSRRRRRVLIQTVAVAVVVALVAGVVALVANARVQRINVAVVVSNLDAGQLGGQEAVAAAQWAADAWNAQSGSTGLRLDVTTFVDNGDPATAQAVARQIVDDGGFAAVIGHSLSSTSLAAAPIYAEAGLPAITPSATADDVTAGNPWYFRTVFDNTQQGSSMAVYASGVLDERAATIVSTDDSYGRSLRDGFIATYSQLGDIAADIVVSADPARQQQDLSAAATQVAALPDPGVVVLLAVDEDASALAGELSRLGVGARIMAPDALATVGFFSRLAQVSSTVVNESLAATPLTEGTLTGAAVTFYDQFAQAQGSAPSWVPGLVHDAVDAIAEATMRAGADPADASGLRVGIRDALSRARSPETALPVLTGSLWFEPGNSAAREVAFVDGRVTRDGRVTVESAAEQITAYSPEPGVPLTEAVRRGTAVVALGEPYTIQRVVTTGFNINQVSSLDPATQTFDADFFIWFTYRGEPGAPTEVQFVNSVDPELSLGEPQRVSIEGGERYELYRVRGTFTTQMDFRDFPFDEQDLTIVVQNTELPAARMTYVPDPDNLEQTQTERLASGVDAGATIDQIPNWQADAITFYPSSVGTDQTLGDPSAAGTAQGLTYSQMVADTLVSRDVTSFLIKNLLPLVLLALVTYVALWYPFEDAGTRVSFGITGILTGAVLLSGVTASLPSVDYTVAIEWAFYAFIVLSGLLVLGSLAGQRLVNRRQLAKARSLDRAMRIGYPVFVLAVAAAYVIAF